MSIKIEVKRPTSNIASKKRFNGTVKWFNPKIGYGFLTKDDGEQIFVHYNSVLMDGYRKLTAGQIVSFGVIPYGKYQQATEVKINEATQ